LLLLTALGCGPKVCPEESFTNSVGMEMVKLSSGYYVSKFETRQVEFEAVMGVNPSIPRGAILPVNNLTGTDAEEFCVKLTDVERAAGRLPRGYVYSLPTFDQWLEYTADADLKGSITPFGTPGREYAAPLPVGSGEVNRLGLYDLRGNVTEYSKDLYNTGSKLILGADYAQYQTDHLPIKNRAGFMNANAKSLAVGFRCVLVRQASAVGVPPRIP
jgi:formylglycine-generating enzyme required for sulfatase activity